MANLFGSIRRMCPFCCEDIETGEDYELWLGPGPLDGMTLHSRCAAQKVFADEQTKTTPGKSGFQ